jgi:molybdate transport system substrate-binding protein
MRGPSPLTAAVGSLAALGLLVTGLWWRERADPTPDRPLIVYAAAATRPAMEAVAVDYQRETGRPVELRFGASEDILTKAGMPSPTEPADLFLPADDSYVRLAEQRGLVAESIPFARMRGVVLLAKSNPKQIRTWDDLVRAGVRVAVPNPGAAVGKLARDHLAKTGRWPALRPHAVDTGTVTEAANAARAGGVDAAIVWDAVAGNYPDQTALALPELDGVIGRVEIAVLQQSRDPAAALRFARYVADPAGGLPHFRDHGFRVIAGETR